MPLTDAPGKARALYEARQTRQQIEPFTDADPDLGMADGYAVQQELVKLLLADGDRIVGYKVGLTSKPMQKMIGVDQPDYGPVLGSTVYADGDPVPVSAFIQPKIEAEIAFVLGSPLAGPGLSVLDARRAIAGMTAAVEIVDSRFAAELDRVRRRGWAEAVNEREIGVASIAAPVRDVSGDVVAAISIGVPLARCSVMVLRRLAPVIVEAAEAASRRLGWPGEVSRPLQQRKEG